MQDKFVLAEELNVYDIEDLCESMQIFSKDNPNSIHSNVVRPFILKFGRYFREEALVGRWPTIGETTRSLVSNFGGYLHPSTLDKLTTDYRMRKVACEIDTWADYLKSRRGNLPASDRIEDSRIAEILRDYTAYVRAHVYRPRSVNMDAQITAIYEEIRSIKELLQAYER